MAIKNRLEKIKYQIKKKRLGEFSDVKLAQMVQGVYDAAINTGVNLSDITLPTIALGVPISWSVNNTTLTIDTGTVEITDDLTDDVVESLGDQELTGAFVVNEGSGEEFFKLNNEIFELIA